MEWKTVPGFTFLEASSTGAIRFVGARVKDGGTRLVRILPQYAASKGLLNVGVPDLRPDAKHPWRTLGVHRLVCLAFHGLPPKGKPWARRRDATSGDNTPGNVYWSSPTENGQDMATNPCVRRGAAHPNTHLAAAQVAEIRRRYKGRCKSDGALALGTEFGVSRSTIARIVAGKSWS